MTTSRDPHKRYTTTRKSDDESASSDSQLLRQNPPPPPEVGIKVNTREREQMLPRGITCVRLAAGS